MKLRFTGILLGSVLTAGAALAGLPEGIKFFDNQDYAAALAEFTYLAEEGDPTAVYYLGRMYEEGLGVTADKEKAVRYYQMADEAQNAAASAQLGKMMMTGNGMTRNPELGIEFLKKAAYAGNTEAFFELGNAYAEGSGVQKNMTYAFGFYFMAALRGDARAQYQVAKSYLNGSGVPQDYENAVKWYSRAANQGYVKAQFEWAQIRESDPRLKNIGDAYSWYAILAAYNSDAVGQQAAQRRDALAGMFKNAQELMVRQQNMRNWRPKTPEESVPAEERQNTPLPVIPGFNDPETTQKMLAAGTVLLTDGTPFGVSTDMIEAALASQDRTAIETAVQNAADAGKVRAYTFYGDLLRSRFKDEAGALVWYQKGATAGDDYAQYQLAKMYCEGRGMENPDAAECYGWLLTAAEKSDSVIADSIQSATDSVLAAMTPDEKTRGEALAEERRGGNKDDAQNQPGVFKLF